MSAHTYKKSLEAAAGLPLDSAGLSGADLFQAVGVKSASMSAIGAGADGARLARLAGTGVIDDFTRANGALAGMKPSDGRPHTWLTSAALITVAGNLLVHDASGNAIAKINTELYDNVIVKCRVVDMGAGFGPRLILLASPGSLNQGIYVARDNTANTWFLASLTTGSVNTFADAVDVVATDVIEARLHGDLVDVYVNGLYRGTLTGAFAANNGSGGVAGGYQGVWGGAAAGWTIDDFSAVPFMP